MKIQHAHVATVQILITGCESEEEACDYISETLRSLAPTAHSGGILDWAYLKIGGQFSLPRPVDVPDPYEEGDFL